ncbi:hypothetical protein GCM10020331_014470 [Ectobacillus funiculus]
MQMIIYTIMPTYSIIFFVLNLSASLPYNNANGQATTCVTNRIINRFVELIPRSVPYAVDIVMIVSKPSI